MRKLHWIVFISGTVTTIGQTLIIREGLALFVGNELVSGILLSFWLIWTGLGSLIFSKLNLKKAPLNIYSFLLFILSLLLFLTVIFFRLAPQIFSLPFGEIMGLDKIILISLISLAPTCLVFGALFPAASKILVPEKVYLLESLGSFLGGILITFLLIQILPPLGITSIIVSLLLCSGLILIKQTNFFVLSLLPLLFLIKIHNIETFFRKIQMRGQNLIGLQESKYGVISVTESGAQLNFYTNGLYDFSFPDLYSAEEAVHYPLLLHPCPKKILLVGGGMGNCITQIFKHPDVKGMTYLELDPGLFNIGEKYIGEKLNGINNLKVIFGDARYYIKNTKSRYDVIIINLPDPVNGQINRFYTKEFFKETKKIINPDGILSVRISAPPDIIGPLFAQFLNTVYSTLATSFHNVIVLPAAKTTFIVSDENLPLDNLVSILKERIALKNLNLSYVNRYFFDYNFTDEKLNYIQAGIKKAESHINTDLKPVCYYYTTILWGGIMSENLKNIFIKLFQLNPIFFLLPLVLIFFLFRRKAIIYFSVFSIGASEISVEVILLILFQVLYGYIYGWVGAIIAFFMLGLASGTLYYLKSQHFSRNLITMLSNIEFVISLYFTMIILLSMIRLPVANIIIPILIFIGGFLGGLHFPVSVKILGKEKAGIIYSVDLLGSSLGALVTAVILIPILGIVFTLFIFILLNLLVGIGLRTLNLKSIENHI